VAPTEESGAATVRSVERGPFARKLSIGMRLADLSQTRGFIRLWLFRAIPASLTTYWSNCMRTFLRRAMRLAAGIALITTPAACQKDATGPEVRADLPRQIRECETWNATVCGTWTLDGDHYDAEWTDGSRATIHIVKFTSTRVMFVREDLTGQSAGMTAWYDGVVTEDRVQRGVVTWRKDGIEWGNYWQAEWDDE
jgi:hypothetical protein